MHMELIIVRLDLQLHTSGYFVKFGIKAYSMHLILIILIYRSVNMIYLSNNFFNNFALKVKLGLIRESRAWPIKSIVSLSP